MALAQVIRFDERQAMGRSRRTPHEPATCVVLRLPRPAALPALPTVAGDEDRIAGRGRDPG